MPYIFPYEDVFPYIIGTLIVILLIVRVILARRIKQKHLEARQKYLETRRRDTSDPALH